MFKFLLEFIFPDKERVRRAHEIVNKNTLPAPTHYLEGNIRALFSYSDRDVRTLIHSFKYDRDQGALKFFAPFLADEVLEIVGEHHSLGTVRNIIVTHIPARKERMETLGYDQGENLTKELSRINNSSPLLFDSLLTRKRETRAQTKIEHRHEREENSRNVFKSQQLLDQPIVIVIDDITTTGSTFRDATRALLEAGAREVHCVAIAH